MGQIFTYLRRKETQDSNFRDLAHDLLASKYCVVLTGAGASAESGIPTFRDPADGLWRRYDPMTYATIWGFRRHPEKIWELLRDFLKENDPKPNATHTALAELERMGYVKAIITQNVDNLHQDAGSQKVIEFHGNLMHAVCQSCGAEVPFSKSDAKRLEGMELPPKHNTFFTHTPAHTSTCTGILKPSAVLFGEAIPSRAVRESTAETDKCDLMLVIGTSANVSPASNIPYSAMSRGAKVVEINLESTGLTNRLTDKIIKGRSSRLTETVAALKELLAAKANETQ
eukprot:GDKI01043864.1.p1 GENE.GDKI01043864.1~~GDKI01043864.1.p1  ORF type:complete len:285 (+),score=52.98 GDKI01043864.1:82-936(+)